MSSDMMPPVDVDPSMLDPHIMPAMEAPADDPTNFDDHYSLAPASRIVIYVLLPLMVAAVASRLYTRLWVTRAIGADDYLCLLAAASVIAYAGVTLSILGSPLGPHQWHVRISSITPKFIQFSITVANLYSASAWLLKSSLLVLYLRLFRTDTTGRVLVWFGIVIISVFYAICIILTSVFCRMDQWPSNINPLEFIQLQAESDCNMPQVTLAAAQGVFSTTSDIYVLVIPIFMVWGLRMPMRRRVGICGIFLVGGLATGCSIVTLYFRFSQRGSTDFTWDSTLNMLFGFIELSIGVVCSCMPVGFIIFKRVSTDSWTSLRQYWKTRRFRRSGSETAVGSYESKPPGSSAGLQNGLPKVPRATMTGLRTFLRGDSTRVNATELSTYADLRSVDEEYHDQLKRNWGNESTHSQPRQSEASTRQANMRPATAEQHV